MISCMYMSLAMPVWNLISQMSETFWASYRHISFKICSLWKNLGYWERLNGVRVQWSDRSFEEWQCLRIRKTAPAYRDPFHIRLRHSPSCYLQTINQSYIQYLYDIHVMRMNLKKKLKINRKINTFVCLHNINKKITTIFDKFKQMKTKISFEITIFKRDLVVRGECDLKKGNSGK